MGEDTTVQENTGDAGVASTEAETTAAGAAEETAAEVAPAAEEAAPAEETADESEEVEGRDPSTPVADGEELTPEESRARSNYLVSHPDERTAYDPTSADGGAV